MHYKLVDEKPKTFVVVARQVPRRFSIAPTAAASVDGA